MKTLKSLPIIFLLFATSFAAFAHKSVEFPVNNESEIVKQARDIVKGAKANDWYSYALAAEKCLRIATNIEEAKSWLETSVKIKEAGFNTMLLGDYHLISGDREKAVELYKKSLLVADLNEEGYDPAKVQAKILRTQI